MNTGRYYVYILSSRSRVLYIGITNDLEGRIAKHKAGVGSVFTSKYKVNRLVYVEEFASINEAIAREKWLKDLLREKKVALIESMNPAWNDLAAQM